MVHPADVLLAGLFPEAAIPVLRPEGVLPSAKCALGASDGALPAAMADAPV